MRNERPNPWSGIAAALALAMSIGVFPSHVVAANTTDSASDRLSDADEIWVISTRWVREAPCDELPARLRVYRCDNGCWKRERFESFVIQHDPEAITVFYVHGNRYTSQDALERGCLAYRRLKQRRRPTERLRFVIWSWPSDPVPGLVNDVRTKAERTDLEGFYLGTAISHLPADARVSLFGFSFGTRVISGALHLLGGGLLEGRQLPPELLTPRVPFRAALMAPAFQNTWLLPGSFHSRTLTQVDRMLVLYNPRDPVLRRYRLISPNSDPEALGYTGLVGLERLGPLGRRVSQIDVSGEIGRSHDELDYFYSSYFSLVREYVLWRTWR